MKLGELKEYDGSKVLQDEETILRYPVDAFEDGDPRLIRAALAGVASTTSKRLPRS